MSVLAAALMLLGVLGWPTRGRRRSQGVVLAGLSSPVAQSHPVSSERHRRRRRALVAGEGVRHGDRGRLGRLTSRTAAARRRDVAADRESVLVILDALGPALQAGLSPAAALRCLDLSDTSSGRLATLPQQLIRVADEGSALAPVWANAAATCGSPELNVVAQVWGLSEALGSPLADGIQLAAGLLRQRAAHERRIAVAVAGPRATTAVLTALPLAGPGVGLLLGVAPTSFYSGPALASTCLGVVLVAAGRCWSAAMVGRLTRPRPARGEGG